MATRINPNEAGSVGRAAHRNGFAASRLRASRKGNDFS